MQQPWIHPCSQNNTQVLSTEHPSLKVKHYNHSQPSSNTDQGMPVHLHELIRTVTRTTEKGWVGGGGGHSSPTGVFVAAKARSATIQAKSSTIRPSISASLNITSASSVLHSAVGNGGWKTYKTKWETVLKTYILKTSKNTTETEHTVRVCGSFIHYG